MNWLQRACKDEPFGAALLASGVSEEVVIRSCMDPRVSLPEEGSSGLFDALEDMNATPCLTKCLAIYAAN